MKKHQTKAFTLVELIITITILAILATIGFMSYQSYTGEARDSSRITSLRTIHNGLTISYVQKQIYPTPDNYIDIVGVSKQGYIGDTVSKAIRGEGFKDPKDGLNYLYSLDYTGKKIQLSTFLEGTNSKTSLGYNYDLVNQVLSENIDYSDRNIYVIGDMVCALLDPITKVPVNILNLTGTLDLTKTSSEYTAVCSDKTSSGTLTGTGQNLLTNISIVQNSCVLGNTVVTSGQQLTAYNTTTVAYNQTCIPVSRSCNNGVLSGDSSYMYDTCSPAAALNCSRTTYNGYSVPAINHNATQTITKNITGGVRDISASCVNGTLSYGTENINCSTNYVLQGGICVRDVCTGSAPDWSIVNGVQKYNVSWTHNTIAGQCTFVCQAGYYWNTTACARASAGYMVRTQGQTTQTACTNNNTYQNLTGQTSCKTVSSGYYSTPIGVGAKTGQTQCEANNYCVSGVKTSCPVGTSSPVGSTSSRACTTNTYTVSGSFGTNANGATVNLCGKTTTADTAGNFTVTANYGTVCNNVTLTKTNYICTTTTNGPASLTSNISNIAGNCTANTQTYTCTAKPATGTLWNTVSSYTQTWNGTSWAPANSTTAYNTTASTTSCNYKCATSYHRESSLCKSDSQTISITDGTCTQTWNSTTSTRNACSSGTCTNGVTWDSTYACAVPVNGTCGTSNGVATRTSPTLNLCSVGTATSVTNGTYTFTWSCNGSNGGTNASCSANKQQTYTCTAKPATGTLWNTVSSYTQTWNGTSWAPANSTTAYNTTVSTTSCNYKCATSYHTENSGVSCISDTKSCTITNGVGSQTRSTTTNTRGTCTVVTCNTGYTNISNVCTIIGTSSSSPRLSCLDRKNKFPTSVSGNYWIKPGTAAAFQVYCDMTTDGGGWTRVFYSNSASVARTSIDGENWNIGNTLSVNFSILYEMRNRKNNSGVYEFRLSNDAGIYNRFTQTNAYNANPVGNSYTRKGGNFTFTWGSTWYGLATSNFGAATMRSYCSLATTYEGNSRRNCFQDQDAASFGAGPWQYADAAQAWVQIYQK